MGEKRSNYELRQERRLSLLTSPALAPSSLVCLSLPNVCLFRLPRLPLFQLPEQAREAPLLLLLSLLPTHLLPFPILQHLPRLLH